MNNIITLVLGDWSHDGHGHSESINIRSNLDKDAMNEAYRAGTKKLGFDFCGEVCEDYEDSKIELEKWKKLKELGYQEEHIENDEDYDDDEIYLDTEGFADIYLFIVKLGNDKFDFDYLKEKENPQIKIGGYGLFQ